jgi:ComF family protein
MDICNHCRTGLPYNLNCCRICALPLAQQAPERPVCGNCLRHPPSFDSCHAAFTYDYPISNLVSSFKFAGELHTGRLLAMLLIDSIEAARPPLPELLIPVPLHRARLRERGFNQALELARPLGRRFGIPVQAHGCQRIRATAAQSSLHQLERRKNIRGAFTLEKVINAGHVAIVDDVVTTGSTAAELAHTLKRAGVGRVDVWTLARTP